jgi:UDP-N-acetylmuramoyl-L-alanyl-D-glutamate--2,6-diaminopimelate ligase
VGVDPLVGGVAHDSRAVNPGDLFVAIPGARHDGRAFAAEAVGRGAVAVVAAGDPLVPVAAPWLRTADPRAVMGTLAARAYRHPDRELLLLGVTGTNGKSTTAILLRRMLTAGGREAGLVGSLVYEFGSWSVPAARTTPESADLLRLLRRMADEGARAVAMEVSSHALALGRVSELAFDGAVFTNLTRDHFDFHRDFADYFAAKRRLFELLKPTGKAVVNTDDPYGRVLADELPAVLGADRVITFGEAGMVRPTAVELSAAGTRLTLETPWGRLELASALRGRFNVENLTAACALALALGVAPPAVAQAVAATGPVPGRMEPVAAGQPFPVFIDYSHTPASLEAAIRSVKELSGRKIIVVFGCGGDRDPGKRPLMGRIAGELAELPIVTSDNPRTEDPLRIIAAVEEGLKESGSRDYRVVPDRREAIRRAIAVAGPEWAVLVAGKGNEAVQVVGHEARYFHDREEIEKALEERFGATKRV